jgi:hypothetical protein
MKSITLSQRAVRTLCLATAAAALSPAGAQNIERMRMTDGDLNCAQIYAEVQQMDTMIKIMGSAPAAPAPQTPAATPQQVAGMAGLLGGQTNGSTANEQARQLMLMSNDPKVRAAANDPMAVAQFQAVLTNPQAAVAMQRAAAAGVSSASMQNSMGLLGAVQMAANNAQANNTGAAAPAAAPAANNMLGGLFGALAARGGSGGSQAAGLFGNMLQGNANAAPAAQQAAAPVAQAAPAQGSAVVAQAQGRKEHLTGMFLNKGCKTSDIAR